MGKWDKFWTKHKDAINQTILDWRQKGRASLKLIGLRTVSSREDLYTEDEITFNSPSSKLSGKQHMLDLHRTVAPMLTSGEKIKVRITKIGNDDYLEFSK